MRSFSKMMKTSKIYQHGEVALLCSWRSTATHRKLLLREDFPAEAKSSRDFLPRFVSIKTGDFFEILYS